MSSKLYTSKKKNARIQTPDVSTAPASGIFESRPFVPQQEATQQSQPDINTALTQSQRYGHNLSQVNFAQLSTPTQPKTRLGNPLQLQKLPAAPLQAKLAIGKPGDRYEQEADRVAEQVVSNLHAPTPRQSNQSQNLQREAVPQEEDKLQRQPKASVIQRQEMPEEQDKLQMKPSASLQNNEGRLPTSNLEASIQKAKGHGQALSDDIRTPMEQAFGTDFSGVKVHTDSQSHQINQSIQAKAFTTGNDIFFRQGAYNPDSQQGQQLLAHELTHVVQQNTGVVQRAPSDPDDGFTLVENKKKKNKKNQGSQEQFTDPVQQAKALLNKWVDNEVQRITKDIENILTNQNRDKWGTVPLNNPDYQLLKSTNEKATEYKITVVERIKELHKEGNTVQYPGWDGITWYHTTGRGKGAAGFNLTGHKPKWRGAQDTLFNIHIQ